MFQSAHTGGEVGNLVSKSRVEGVADLLIVCKHHLPQYTCPPPSYHRSDLAATSQPVQGRSCMRSSGGEVGNLVSKSRVVRGRS
eukprot:108030-Prymnesium_polylepis.1